MQEFTEVKAALMNKHRDIQDVIFSNNPTLATLERGILEISKTETYSPDHLVRAYAAAVELCAQEYHNKIGTRFQFIRVEDFLEKCLSQKNLFNAKGYYIGVRENTVVAVHAQKGLSVDLCFGFFDAVKEAITSPVFILLYRADKSDLELMQYIYQLRQEFGGWQRAMLRRLIDEGVAFRKDW